VLRRRGWNRAGEPGDEVSVGLELRPKVEAEGVFPRGRSNFLPQGLVSGQAADRRRKLGRGGGEQNLLLMGDGPPSCPYRGRDHRLAVGERLENLHRY